MRLGLAEVLDTGSLCISKLSFTPQLQPGVHQDPLQSFNRFNGNYIVEPPRVWVDNVVALETEGKCYLEREAESKCSELEGDWVGPPVSYFERNNDIDSDEYVDMLEFRLVYQGALPGSGNNSRHAAEKHRIRKQLHRQLALLWTSQPLLAAYQKHFNEPPPNGRKFLEKNAKQMHGFEFLALVNERLDQVCALDILLLRREKPGSLITQGGDVDNRVKTLFDALSIPKSNSGLTSPESDECPFYCVMEDDKLVTTVRVTADRLLIPPEQPEPQNYVHAIIEVKIQVSTDFMWGSQYFRRGGPFS